MIEVGFRVDSSQYIANSVHNSRTILINWLKSLGFTDAICLLFKNHSINSANFASLCEDDLREMGISSIGDRKQLMLIVSNWNCDVRELLLQFENNTIPEKTFGITAPSSSTPSEILPTKNKLTEATSNMLRQTVINIDETTENLRRTSLSATQNYFINDSDWENVNISTSSCKVFISFLYGVVSIILCSFMVVLTQERLPNTSKHPPLPDIFLENIPYLTWALKTSECIILILSLIWLFVLIFHKHRKILFRRYCSLVGTIYLLRCITMFITSMSVPGYHSSNECKAIVFNSFKERIIRTLEIYSGMGMRVQGVHTCGDYMFSGHTSMITLLNLFIIEYTPKSFYLLHVCTIFFNASGVFFVVASHEHYSIDAFIALYICNRLFAYYHWLANTHFIPHVDKKRLKLWFPMFYYFESETIFAVPNEYHKKFCCIELPDWNTLNNFYNKYNILKDFNISPQTDTAIYVPPFQTQHSLIDKLN